jgi:hypothetical protein
MDGTYQKPVRGDGTSVRAGRQPSLAVWMCLPERRLIIEQAALFVCLDPESKYPGRDAIKVLVKKYSKAALRNFALFYYYPPYIPFTKVKVITDEY